MPRIAPTEYEDPFVEPPSQVTVVLPTLADAQPVEHGSMCLLGIGALVLASVGTLAGNAVVAGCGAVIAGLLILWRLVVDLRRGVTSSIWGTWRRDENRVAFRCNVCFWTFVALCLFLAGLMIGLEWVPLPAT
jgi:hypothetical protein